MGPDKPNVPWNNIRHNTEDEWDDWEEFRERKSPFPSHSYEEKILETAHINISQTKHLVLDHSFQAVVHNPLRCGMLKYDLFLLQHHMGVRRERHTADICMLAHVYMAGKLLYPDAPSWPDMEFVIQKQDPNYLFLGGIPKTLMESNRKVQLALGQSPSSIATERRTKRNQYRPGSKVKPRFFEDRSILGPILMERMVSSTTSAESVNAMRPEHIDNELAERLFISLVDEYQERSIRGSISLLRQLGPLLQGEAAKTYFDWRLMRRMCGDIWGDIIAALRRSGGDRWSEWLAESSIYSSIYIASEILVWTADDEYNNKGRILRGDRKFAPRLRKAWKIIQKAIMKPTAKLAVDAYAMVPSFVIVGDRYYREDGDENDSDWYDDDGDPNGGHDHGDGGVPSSDLDRDTEHGRVDGDYGNEQTSQVATITAKINDLKPTESSAGLMTKNDPGHIHKQGHSDDESSAAEIAKYHGYFYENNERIKQHSLDHPDNKIESDCDSGYDHSRDYFPILHDRDIYPPDYAPYDFSYVYNPYLIRQLSPWYQNWDKRRIAQTRVLFMGDTMCRARHRNMTARVARLFGSGGLRRVEGEGEGAMRREGQAGYRG
ncbi:hypothetical protein K458DRAFT_426099 [Lentithecium fluviatile CBS 122367]|uniref:Uncharacterized protein n=1 Tax=Lentithecium fluviatile CBS 122367 TaxID=1168545 RepID=A0A6G1JKE0_9PLEO|nr:hypothetical protein K458DRAFT_426099 [Lentithecium fluviatile CBS 122367]